MMGPIEEVLREKLFPALFGGEEINTNFRKILGHSVKHGGLGIPDSRSPEESAYNTPKAAIRELVDSLLGGSVLNYVGHRACVRKLSQTTRQTNMSIELAEVFRHQEQAGGQERNRLHRTTMNRAWLSAVPYRLSGTELSWEELRDNLRLRYGLMPQDIPTACDNAVRSY